MIAAELHVVALSVHLPHSSTVLTAMRTAHVQMGCRTKHSHIFLIPQLSALFDDPQLVKRMEYRDRYLSDSPTEDGGTIKGKISDIFDGSYYRDLLNAEYLVSSQTRPISFFSDKHDIALGLSSDGFAPFKKRK